MSDLDLLSGTIAARIRALAEVEALYPPRRTAAPARPATSASDIVAALQADPAVRARIDGGTTLVEVSLAVAAAAPAPTTALAVAALVAAVLDGSAITDRRITVRVSSVGS